MLNPTITNNDLLNFICEEVLDRVVYYLNYWQLDEPYLSLENLMRVIARIVMGVYTKSEIESKTGKVEMGVKSMSDNGQSITFSDTAKVFLNTSDDQKIFTGFTDLLDRYRLANVP